MKLFDEKESTKIKYGLSLTSRIFWVILFVLLVVIFVCYINRDKTSSAFSDNASVGAENMVEGNDINTVIDNTPYDGLLGMDKNTAGDLTDISISNDETLNKDEPTATPTSDEQTANTDKDMSNYFSIMLPSGDLESVKINPYITKNTYESEKFTVNNKGRASYDSKKMQLGISVSSTQGFIDFIKVKKDGIDYAMLSAGCRGYGTGQIVLDSYLADNLYNAKNAGISTGIYFSSQAISNEEAIEEANLVLSLISMYTVDYPIVFRMDDIINDTSRSKDLSKMDRTSIAKSFLDTIKNAGYDTALYGSPYFLIKKVELSQFNGYDIWIASDITNPYFPYQFDMWEYTRSVNVDGVAGNVPMSISMLDYKIK